MTEQYLHQASASSNCSTQPSDVAVLRCISQGNVILLTVHLYCEGGVVADIPGFGCVHQDGVVLQRLDGLELMLTNSKVEGGAC